MVGTDPDADPDAVYNGIVSTWFDNDLMTDFEVSPDNDKADTFYMWMSKGHKSKRVNVELLSNKHYLVVSTTTHNATVSDIDDEEVGVKVKYSCKAPTERGIVVAMQITFPDDPLDKSVEIYWVKECSELPWSKGFIVIMV